MSETVVGLFESPIAANQLVAALNANGIASDGIRVLAKPASFPVNSATSTPEIDFGAALYRDLHSMGATDGECEAYLDGLTRGNVLVFATGPPARLILKLP